MIPKRKEEFQGSDKLILACICGFWKWLCLPGNRNRILARSCTCSPEFTDGTRSVKSWLLAQTWRNLQMDAFPDIQPAWIESHPLFPCLGSPHMGLWSPLRDSWEEGVYVFVVIQGRVCVLCGGCHCLLLTPITTECVCSVHTVRLSARYTRRAPHTEACTNIAASGLWIEDSQAQSSWSIIKYLQIIMLCHQSAAAQPSLSEHLHHTRRWNRVRVFEQMDSGFLQAWGCLRPSKILPWPCHRDLSGRSKLKYTSACNRTRARIPGNRKLTESWGYMQKACISTGK